MFMQLFFSKVHTTCHNIVNGIKPGSNSKKTDKQAADCSKAVCWGRKVIYVTCISCSYNNVAKGIRLLESNSCLYRKIFMQVRGFERYIPLYLSKALTCIGYILQNLLLA